MFNLDAISYIGKEGHALTPGQLIIISLIIVLHVENEKMSTYVSF